MFNLPLSRPDKALALSLGLFLFAIYLLTYRGGFHSVDEVSMFAVTESLVKFGRFNTDQIAWTQWTTSQSEAQGFFGPDGHVYSKKGLALSLAQAPLYWLALVTPGLGMLQTVSLLNALLTAATGGLLYLYLRRLRFSQRAAVGGALVFGLATIAWVYSKYLFSEPLAALLLLLAAYWLLGFGQEGGRRRLALAGFAAGLAVLARANNAILLPVFGLYLLYLLATPPPEMQAALALPPGPRRFYLRLSWRQAVAPVAIFGAGAGLALAILVWYNAVRSGSAAETGYDLTLFAGNVFLGFYKLLFSPLRGLFVYSPVLILAPLGWWRLRRSRPAEAWLSAGLVGLTVLLFSAWSSGEGLSWGSRFLVPVVPFLALMLAPLIEPGFGRGAALSPAVAVFGIGLALLSGLVQILGVAINPWVFLSRIQAEFGGEFFLERTQALYDFRYSQIAGQWQNWGVENSDLAWWQPAGIDWPVLLACLALVVVSGILLWRQARLDEGEERRPAGKQIPPSPYLLVSLAAIIVTFFLLRQTNQTDPQFGPPDAGYDRALAMVMQTASADDRILNVAWRHYHVPMNRFKARQPLIGLARRVEPLPPTAYPLLEDALRGENVWLITWGLGPADPTNPVEAWLAGHAFKTGDVWLDDEFRLLRYGTAAPGIPRALAADFEGLVQLKSVRVANAARPGQPLPVELAWQAGRQVDVDYVVFLQLLAPDGTLAAQFDGPPLGGYRPTSTWAAGEVVADKRGIALPPDLPPGEYRLITGLYDARDGTRLTLAGGSDFVDLGPVQIGE